MCDFVGIGQSLTRFFGFSALILLTIFVLTLL